MMFGSGAGARYYAPSLSVLEDARELLLGHLLILRDVTEEKRVQAKILEQQRSLAALHEREHLARELHDSIGQVLSYAAFQVETTEQLIEGGRTPTPWLSLAVSGASSAKRTPMCASRSSTCAPLLQRSGPSLRLSSTTCTASPRTTISRRT